MNNRHTKFLGSASLATLILLLSAQAGAARPVPYSLEPVHFEAVPFFNCAEFGMSFGIFADWVYLEHGLEHYDNQGNLVRINGIGSIVNPRAYNSSDPNKEITEEVMVGTTEHWHVTVRFDDGIATWYKESGISFRAVIPGVGRIALDAGTVIFTSLDGVNFVPKVVTPNRSTQDSEWYAMCSYLQ